tara:strand:+ start:334 stop:627 length:294 start_codon:yes stop_codon:yes gene_type:complete
MKKIRQYLVKKYKLLKSKSLNPYAEELTVFISVKIEILKLYSIFIWLKLNNILKTKNDKIKINTVKKYLLISIKSKLIFVNNSLFINIFFGRLNDNI